VVKDLTFTDADVTKICEKAVVEPEVSAEAPANIDASNSDF